MSSRSVDLYLDDLIEAGKAYVDDSTAEEIRAARGTLTVFLDADAAIAAWDAYLKAALPAGAAEELPPPFRPDGVSAARAREFEAAGGFEAARSAAGEVLPFGATAFIMPR